MIRTLDRYVLKNFLINYVLSLGVMISLYVALDLFANMDEFTEDHEKSAARIMRDIGDYYFFNIPLYFMQLSAVITLFAGCLTLARMQRLNEVTAVLASGTSLYRLVAPLVIAALLMNGLLMLDTEVIIPGIAPQLARSRDDVEGRNAYDLRCINDGSSHLLSAIRFSPGARPEGRKDAGAIRGLIVMELSSDPQTAGRLGDVITAYKAYWNQEQHGWDLEGGVRMSMAGAGLAPGEHDLAYTAESFYPSELTPPELMLRKMRHWVRFLSIRQLNAVEKQKDVNPLQIAQIRHGRFTLPIGNMILLLLGISFFMNRAPTSVLTQGAKALATCAAVFIVTYIGQQAMGGSIGALPPMLTALPAWLPVFLFGPLAVVLLDNVKT